MKQMQIKTIENIPSKDKISMEGNEFTSQNNVSSLEKGIYSYCFVPKNQLARSIIAHKELKSDTRQIETYPLD